MILVEQTSLIVQRQSLPSAVLCSVMSASERRFGRSAVKARCTRSSWMGVPAFFPFPRASFFPDALNQLFAEAIFHAIRSDITSPCSKAASSARSRYPNTGSSRCASSKAFARYASVSSAVVTRSLSQRSSGWRASFSTRHDTTTESRQRRARERAGTSFSRRMRLRQIRRRPAQHLDLLLQQAVALAQVSWRRRLGCGSSRLLVDLDALLACTGPERR